MTDTEHATTKLGDIQKAARDHLWLHFSRMGAYSDEHPIPVIERGEGPYVYDNHGKRYLDGLAGLFTVQLGHGRKDLAEAARAQAEKLAYFPLWSYAHPASVELADRLADYAPADLNRVFFTTSGSEAVETAWKLSRQYFKAIGEPSRYKVVSRNIAYHGTSFGALSITGIPSARIPFEPLVPGARKAMNTNRYRCDDCSHLDQCTMRCADSIEQIIEFEGPESIAAVYVEPVQNSGGCFPPPDGYLPRVREICDRYGVLMVSDEVICAFGRLGEMFGCDRYGYVPDMITCAKGMTSGYSPIGAMIARDKIMQPFLEEGASFAHGITFGGHPVSAAVAIANIDAFEREGILAHVKRNEPGFRSTLERLSDLPIVGDIRGAGYFYGIELVKDKVTKETFSHEEAERLLRGVLSPALFEAGLICRADDRGDPVIQLSPPLICEQEHFDFIEATLRTVLQEAWTHL
jgi:adenosylmethionine-8-amino-7-oxononanoate aminotransferase